MPPTDDQQPRRTCVGCRAKRRQSELLRCALAADGVPVVSRSAHGRGAWLCADNSECLRQAIKRRGFERAWKRPATPSREIEIAFGASASSDVKTNMKN